MPCAFHADRPFPYEKLGPGCQFGVADEDLVDLQDKAWCSFHLPVADWRGNQLPKAEWDEERVESFNEAVFSFVETARQDNRPADLTGVVFPGGVYFGRFSGEASLPETLFNKAQFCGVADFREVQFSGDTDFRKVQFSNEAFFTSTQFSGRAFFISAQFSGRAFFSEARFGGGADFREARFSGGAEFLRVQFSADSAFIQEAQFSGVADFIKARFFHDTLFYEAQFSNAPAFFNEAEFSGNAIFGKTQFSGDADFREARFSGDVAFPEAQFKGDAFFQGRVEAGGSGEGEGGDHFRRVLFSCARFVGTVDFSNRRFLSKTDFSGAKFGGAPLFHNSSLHQDTDFTGTTFSDTKSKEAAQAYRTLKLAMEEKRERNEEAKFYALEQKSLRKQEDTPWRDKVVSFLYEIGSGYGRNFSWPLLWLVFLSAWFFMIYRDIGGIEGIAALSVTIEQYVRPFAVWTSRYQGVLKDCGVSLKLVASLQSLIGIGLFTLFVLAVRRRFRMG
jgi:uncharacterized protein YjbI with pentapeptide repeats